MVVRYSRVNGSETNDVQDFDSKTVQKNEMEIFMFNEGYIWKGEEYFFIPKCINTMHFTKCK
jgi:hypothetical protein